MIFDLYGTDELSVGEVRDLVTLMLSVEFSLRNSGYRGGDYFLWQGDGEEVVTVCGNFEDEDGELFEPEFSEFPVLLQVDGSERAEWIETLIAATGLTLLRRIVL